jgi:hypothetical protein
VAREALVAWALATPRSGGLRRFPEDVDHFCVSGQRHLERAH